MPTAQAQVLDELKVLAQEALAKADIQGDITEQPIHIVLGILGDFSRDIADVGDGEHSDHFLEVFGGLGGTTQILHTKGRRGRNFDWRQHDDENFYTLAGLMYVVWCVHRVMAGGVILWEPCCATWLNMCTNHTKRSRADTTGDENRKDVRQANFTAAVM